MTGWLAQTKADALIAGAGTVSLAEVANENTGLKHVIWVVQRASRHLDWNEVPEGIGGNVGVTVWHEMIEEKKAGAKVELPYRKDGYVPESIFTVWQKMKDDMGDIVEFTQGVTLSSGRQASHIADGSCFIRISLRPYLLLFLLFHRSNVLVPRIYSYQRIRSV